MTPSFLLDLLLALLLLGYLVYGFRRGFVGSMSSFAGIVAGAACALLLIPVFGNLVLDPNLRILATLGVVLLCIVAGSALGALVGRLLRRGLRKVGLALLDRALGAVTGLLIAALVVSALATGLGSLGVPFLSPAIGSSLVLRTIDSLTPDPVKALLAQLRSAVAEEGLPRIVGALGGPTAPPRLPDASTDTPALTAAARSVVRITGVAYACGQSQSGSGFVVAEDRVVTNAHVVAGVAQPVIEIPGRAAQTGTIVYFDPVDDLAVIAVEGLEAPPLDLSTTLPAGSAAVTDGFPLGGPFESRSATVLSVAVIPVDDIYGRSRSTREVYSLAARVQQGDSGGPVLDPAGGVVGVVFARNLDTVNLGYALTMAELSPVADRAPSLGGAVSSGGCIRH